MNPTDLTRVRQTPLRGSLREPTRSNQPEDVKWVHRTTRGAPNELGLGLGLATLPWLGFVPADVRAAPLPAVARVATQLGVEAGALAHYGRRGQTRSDHLRLVTRRLG